MRSALVVAVALLAGWYLRGMNDAESAPATVAAPAAIPASAPETNLPDSSLPRIDPLRVPAESFGERNLFAYREPWGETRPQFTPAPVAQAVDVVPPPSSAAVEVVAPRAPEFGWRFIGAFGSRDVRVAAFARDGEIVTLRVGDRIDDFTLVSIGRESVEVRASDGSLQRVPLVDGV